MDATDGVIDWQIGRSLAETNLHMFEKGLGTDIVLKMGEKAQQLPCHKFILASRSPVFYTMFYGGLPETGSEVIIPDIEYDIMVDFLRYLYNGGKTEIMPNNVMGLMYTAKKYGVQTLTDECRVFLQNEINSSNVCTVMEQAHLFDERKLWENCLTTIFSNAFDVLRNEDHDFHNLCADCMKKIVENDRLNVPEDLIFIACKSWAEEKCGSMNIDINDANLREILGGILFAIRFPFMNEMLFTEMVSHGDILTQEEKLSVYQQFNHSPRDGGPNISEKTKFCSKPRVSAPSYRAERFKEVVGGTLFDFWENDNMIDAISFKASRDISLVGITILSPFQNGIIRGSLSIYDETNICLASRKHLEILQATNDKMVDINFPKPVAISESCWYTVTQQMSGGRSYFGTDGQKEVKGEGVVFRFRNSPMYANNTNVES
ncbi:BTBD6-like protein, partial [Mya arenaria]